MKKIAVLTSGGDAPGMNACIRAVVRSAQEDGYEIVGVLGGYQGLIDASFKQLQLKDVENIISLSGTILKTSRCDEFKTEQGFLTAISNIKKENIDAIIVLGGDGSFAGALRLSKSGINVVCVPCTIDNDLSYTDFTIGFDTAVNTVTSLLGNVRDTSSSHDRVCVVEVMGRHCGEIALHAGVASGAEVVLVPEIKVSTNDICNKISKSISSGEKCVLVVVAEGVCSAQEVAEEIKNELKVDAKSVSLGYVQRGGTPSANDRILATRFGNMAIRLIEKNKFRVAVGITNNKISATNLTKALVQNSKLNKDLYLLNDKLSV